VSIYEITPYERRHRWQVLNLLFNSKRVHTHLDWHETSDWLEETEITVLLAWRETELVGVIGTSAPMGGTSWVRLLALSDPIPGRPLLHKLWETLSRRLAEDGVHLVAVLVVEDWIVDHLRRLGFHHHEDVVTLARSGYTLPSRTPPQIAIRSAEREDLPAILEVDWKAFKIPWQMTLNELRAAYSIAASHTVAMDESRIVGYQLSTLYRQSGHLARLAVLPEMQGRYVGTQLVDDLIRRLLRRGVRAITVNTQASNIRSQRLYERFDFRRNGYDLEVWTVELQPNVGSVEDSKDVP
jgi:ribosomal protein S18 acetylase RimI-like enzyme